VQHPHIAAIAGAITLVSGAHAMDTPQVSMVDAISAAVQEAGGRATSAELKCKDGACAYRVELAHANGRSSSVTIDAQTGQVIPERDSLPAAASPANDGYTYQGFHAKPRLFAAFGAGQIAGMGNVILNPTVTGGLDVTLTSDAFPKVEVDARTALIYGKVQSTNSKSSPSLQELRGRIHTIYNFYNDKNISKAGVGLYVEYAHAFRDKPRYVPQDTASIYAAEENETIYNQFDTGVDFRFSIRDDRVSSELHNILFTSGNRIGPNLLTYKPILGFMWHNQFYITGNVDNPGLSFLTDLEFYFAKKAGVGYFNTHDGLGGTKREIYLSYALAYTPTPQTTFTLRTYGYNNLNRGSSASSPFGFKDGLSLGVSTGF
jgi:hypothetical protein